MAVEPSEPVTEVFGGEGEEESTGESELEEDMVRGLSINGSLLVTKGYWRHFNRCGEPSHMPTCRSLRSVTQKAVRRWRRRRCRVR